MMDADFFVSAFVTLFVVIDPVGVSQIFTALTRGMPDAERRSIAVRACLTAAGLLMFFGLFGEAVLSFVGITMPAFRIAGGLLLFLIALDMLFDRSRARKERRADDAADDPSVFPLAIPLIAGPGSIASVILLVGRTEETPVALAGVLAMTLVVVGICFALFLLAGRTERLLRQTGIDVITRLLGMLLAALSVQFVIDGLANAGFRPGG